VKWIFNWSGTKVDQQKERLKDLALELGKSRFEDAKDDSKHDLSKKMTRMFCIPLPINKLTLD